jgi:hypothetical protein
VVAGDLEAVEEAAGLHAQREGDADVAALVRTARTRDRQLILLLSSGSLQLTLLQGGLVGCAAAGIARAWSWCCLGCYYL